MKLIIQSLLVLMVFTVLTGLLYPLAVTGLAQLFFNKQANGSLIYRDNTAIGSSLIGQLFTNANYFHGRPSANNYDAMKSGGYNLGPASTKLIHTVSERVVQARQENYLSNETLLPPDMVLASASGLDPDISPSNAKLQVKRIAKARGMTEDKILPLIEINKSRTLFGFWGEPKVNVLQLNLELDTLK